MEIGKSWKAIVLFGFGFGLGLLDLVWEKELEKNNTHY